MSQIEMEEIMRAGHTLNSIAHGKGIFTPESTPFDASRSVALKGFSDATNERSSAISEREVQGSLIRGAFSPQGNQETNEPGLNVSNPQCNITDRAEFSVYKTETPCNVMKLTDQDGLLDTTTNMMYFPLVKSEYMPEGRRLRDRAFWGESPVKDLLTYDPALFPGWCGKSASFAVWWDPRPHKSGLPPGGYIVSKFEHVDAKRKWSMYIGDGGIHSFGDPSVSIQTPTNFDWGVRRHVVLVFNHLTDKVCAYIDGAELGCRQLADGAVASLDCGPTVYVGLNHRIPGAWQPTTVMQVQSNESCIQRAIVHPARTLRNFFAPSLQSFTLSLVCEIRFRGNEDVMDWFLSFCVS
jgi:hypothetical protein